MFLTERLKAVYKKYEQFSKTPYISQPVNNAIVLGLQNQKTVTITKQTETILTHNISNEENGTKNKIKTKIINSVIYYEQIPFIKAQFYLDYRSFPL